MSVAREERGFEAVCREVTPQVRATVGRHGDVLARFAEDADDLVQETMIRLFRRYETTGVRNPAGLACRAAINLVADRRRKRSPRTVELPDELIDVDALGSVCKEVEAREADDELAEIRLLVLDEIEQRVVDARDEGLRRERIAQDLRISVRDVQTTLQRARRKLERALAERDRHGLCRLVAPALAEIASGTLERGDRRWAAGHLHLDRCSRCRQGLAALLRAAELAALRERDERREKRFGSCVSKPRDLRLKGYGGSQSNGIPASRAG
jgi:RNA polymerase sigma factor (sigma-70 family)